MLSMPSCFFDRADSRVRRRGKTQKEFRIATGCDFIEFEAALLEVFIRRSTYISNTGLYRYMKFSLSQEDCGIFPSILRLATLFLQNLYLT